MTQSQDWWPADYGHYGGLFIRMSWHAAGTYRIADGRGGGGRGAQRFAPLNSWPDNASLDKARRLLWPIKQKYGKKISWADLLVFAGNCAYESMGLKTFGFAFGREDIWEPEEILFGQRTPGSGTESATAASATLPGSLRRVRHGPDLRQSRRARTASRIRWQSAIDIRETFGRMAMNDEETAALIVGGHTVGKTHGAGDADEHVGPEPEGCPLAVPGSRLAEHVRHRCRQGRDHQRPRGGVDADPDQVGQHLPGDPVRPRVGAHQEPRGRLAVGREGRRSDHSRPVRWAAAASRRCWSPDLALRLDPVYEQITRRWLDHPEEMSEAFAKAWYKLLHRDMGPVSRFLGPWVPEPQLWQDPVPDRRPRADRREGHRGPEGEDSRFGTVGAATGLDGVGVGGQLPRHRPTRRRQRRRGFALRRRRTGRPTSLPNWRRRFRRWSRSSRTSTVRLPAARRFRSPTSMVLGGSAAIEKAAKDAGLRDRGAVLARPYRRHPGGDRRRVVRLAEDEADGFRNYLRAGREAAAGAPAGREGLPAGPHRAGDDRPDRWFASVGRQPRRQQARCVHRPSRAP